MEKFIKQYGIWIVGAIAIYWFFIREKENGALPPAPEESNATGDDCGCGEGFGCGTCSGTDIICCSNAGCSEGKTCGGISSSVGPSRGGRTRRMSRTSSRYRGDDISNWKLFGKRMPRIKRAKF